jgi:hypothetical protein
MTMISAIGLGLSEYSQIPDGPHACTGGPVLHLLSLYSPSLEPCRYQGVVDSLQNAVPLWCLTNRLTTNQQELSPRTSILTRANRAFRLGLIHQLFELRAPSLNARA